MQNKKVLISGLYLITISVMSHMLYGMQEQNGGNQNRMQLEAGNPFPVHKEIKNFAPYVIMTMTNVTSKKVLQQAGLQDKSLNIDRFPLLHINDILTVAVGSGMVYAHCRNKQDVAKEICKISGIGLLREILINIAKNGFRYGISIGKSQFNVNIPQILPNDHQVLGCIEISGDSCLRFLVDQLIIRSFQFCGLMK